MKKELSPSLVASALAGMMLFSILISVFFFQPQSLRLDESQSIWQSAHSPIGIVKLIAQDVHVPLYTELLHAWRVAFGSSIPVARTLSLVFYLLSIPAMYLLGSTIYSRRIGLFATLLLTLSPFLNWYGNEIRMYSLFLLFAIVNQYFFVMLLRPHRKSAWVGYTITAVLGLYTHYFFVCILIGQIVFYIMRSHLFQKKVFRSFMTVSAIVAASFIPWAWYVIHIGQAVNQEPRLITPTTVDLFNAFAQFFFGFQTDPINTVILSLWPLGVLIVFLTLRNRFTIQKETEYLFISVVVSYVLIFGVSILIEPVFVSRYLVFTTPALFLLTASLFMRYAPITLRVGLVGLMALMLTTQITSANNPMKEEYRSAVAYVSEHAAPSDVVIVTAPFTLYPVEYYYRGIAPLVTLPYWDQYAFGPIPSYSDADMQKQVAALAGSYQDAWLIMSYDQGYESNVRIYMDTHYNRVFVQRFSRDLTIYEYKFRYDTPLSATTVLH